MSVAREDPPELLNDDPAGFAWGVWHDRTPRLVAQIRDAHPYSPGQRAALDALLAEIAGGPMLPPEPGSPDGDEWAAWGAEYFGRPWSSAPFLWSESWFFRRLLAAVGYFAAGPWQAADPFSPLKAAELTDPALGPDLAATGGLERLPVAGQGQGQAKLLAALWGNRADLGFRIGQTATAPAAASLVADGSAALWALLHRDAHVVLVADNAGREMLADLVLIDHLLQHGLAAKIMLHVKPHPYYVSDATAADVTACLHRLTAAGGHPARIAQRLHAAAATGAFTLATHVFYCEPWSYHHMPADLADQFAAATVTILKGDLNYRRLTGDRAWPPTTPFAAVTSYFPGPAAALRTLKSDVVTGLDAATVARLDAATPRWRTDGTHALLQVSPA